MTGEELTEMRCRVGKAMLAVVPHTLATGGVVIIDDSPAIYLSPAQMAFLSILLRQRDQDSERHEAVRGFVSSTVLVSSLPWDTAHPGTEHLKQLVRRTRRRLGASGVEIEGSCGLGYRVRFDPCRVLDAGPERTDSEAGESATYEVDLPVTSLGKQTPALDHDVAETMTRHYP